MPRTPAAHSPGPDARVFHVARTKTQHAILLAVVLGLIGLAVVSVGAKAVPNARLVGGVQVVLAVGVAISAVRMRRDRRPRLIVDDDGLWYRDWQVPRLPWDAIESARIDGSRVQGYVAVRVKPDHAGAIDGGNARLVRDGELRIPNGMLDAPLTDICEAIRARRDRHAA